jgi:hypothetical protein
MLSGQWNSEDYLSKLWQCFPALMIESTYFSSQTRYHTHSDRPARPLDFIVAKSTT